MSLENKNILFIDDLPDSIEIHVKRLREVGASVTVLRTIDEAISDLKNIDFAVIDLYLPRGYESVKLYENHIKPTKMNQGELLAYHCKNKIEKNIPYLYLTSQQDFYQGSEAGLLFDKSGSNIDGVIEKIEQLLCQVASS